jgi:hypothetical protein
MCRRLGKADSIESVAKERGVEMPSITREKLVEVLRYHPETGAFTCSLCMPVEAITADKPTVGN